MLDVVNERIRCGVAVHFFAGRTALYAKPANQRREDCLLKFGGSRGILANQTTVDISAPVFVWEGSHGYSLFFFRSTTIASQDIRVANSDFFDTESGGGSERRAFFRGRQTPATNRRFALFVSRRVISIESDCSLSRMLGPSTTAMRPPGRT